MYANTLVNKVVNFYLSNEQSFALWLRQVDKNMLCLVVAAETLDYPRRVVDVDDSIDVLDEHIAGISERVEQLL